MFLLLVTCGVIYIVQAAAAALRDWETRYNCERFSLALKGRTPAEKLAARQPPVRAA